MNRQPALVLAVPLALAVSIAALGCSGSGGGGGGGSQNCMGGAGTGTFVIDGQQANDCTYSLVAGSGQTISVSMGAISARTLEVDVHGTTPGTYKCEDGGAALAYDDGRAWLAEDVPPPIGSCAVDVSAATATHISFTVSGVVETPNGSGGYDQQNVTGSGDLTLN